MSVIQANHYQSKRNISYYEIKVNPLNSLLHDAVLPIELDGMILGYCKIASTVDNLTKNYNKHLELNFIVTDKPIIITGLLVTDILQIKAKSHLIINAVLLIQADLNIEGTCLELCQEYHAKNIFLSASEKLIIYDYLYALHALKIVSPVALLHSKIESGQKLKIQTATTLWIKGLAEVIAGEKLKIHASQFIHSGHIRSSHHTRIHAAHLEQTGKMTLSLSSYIHVKKWTYKKQAQCEWLLENLPIDVKQKYHLYVENIFYIEPEAQCKLIQRNAKLRYLKNAGNLQLEMSQIKIEHFVNEGFQCILYKANLLVKKTLFSKKNSLFFVGASDIQAFSMTLHEAAMYESNITVDNLTVQDDLLLNAALINAKKAWVGAQGKLELTKHACFQTETYFQTEKNSEIKVSDSDMIHHEWINQGKASITNGFLCLNTHLLNEGSLSFQHKTFCQITGVLTLNGSTEMDTSYLSVSILEINVSITLAHMQCEVNRYWEVAPNSTITLHKTHFSGTKGLVNGDITLRKKSRLQTQSLIQNAGVFHAQEKSKIRVENIFLSEKNTQQIFTDDVVCEGGAAWFSGEVKIDNHVTMNFNKVGLLSKVAINNSVLQGVSHILWGKDGQSSINESDVLSQHHIIEGKMAVSHRTRLGGKYITLHKTGAVHSQNSEIAALKRVNNFGDISLQNSNMFADDISIYNKLNTTDSSLLSKNSFIISSEGELIALNTVVEAEEIINFNLIESSSSTFHGKSEINNQINARIVVKKSSASDSKETQEAPTVLLSKTIVNCPGSLIHGKGSLAIQAKVATNFGTIKLKGRLFQKGNIILNVVGVTSAKDIQVLAKWGYLNLCSFTNAKRNACVTAGISLNFGIEHARDMWMNNSVIGVNIGIISSYTVINNSFLSLDYGFILPSIPTKEGVLSFPRFLALTRTIGKAFLPRWANTVDMGIAGVQFAYSALPLLKRVYHKLYDLRQEENGWSNEWKRMQTTDYWFESLPTLLAAKNVFAIGCDLAWTVPGAYYEIKNHAKTHTVWDISSLDVADILVGVGAAFLPSYTSTSLAEMHGGITCTGVVNYNTLRWHNNGVLVGAVVSGNMTHMENEGMIAGYKVYFSGEILADNGKIYGANEGSLDFSTKNGVSSSSQEVPDDSLLDGITESIQMHESMKAKNYYFLQNSTQPQKKLKPSKLMTKAIVILLNSPLGTEALGLCLRKYIESRLKQTKVLLNSIQMSVTRRFHQLKTRAFYQKLQKDSFEKIQELKLIFIESFFEYSKLPTASEEKNEILSLKLTEFIQAVEKICNTIENTLEATTLIEGKWQALLESSQILLPIEIFSLIEEILNIRQYIKKCIAESEKIIARKNTIPLTLIALEYAQSNHSLQHFGIFRQIASCDTDINLSNKHQELYQQMLMATAFIPQLINMTSAQKTGFILTQQGFNVASHLIKQVVFFLEEQIKMKEQMSAVLNQLNQSFIEAGLLEDEKFISQITQLQQTYIHCAWERQVRLYTNLMSNADTEEKKNFITEQWVDRSKTFTEVIEKQHKIVLKSVETMHTTAVTSNEKKINQLHLQSQLFYKNKGNLRKQTLHALQQMNEANDLFSSIHFTCSSEVSP